MNILFYDLTYPSGHKYFDEKMIDNIANVCNLTVLCPPNWYRTTTNKAQYIYSAKELPYDRASTRRIFLNALHNTKEAKKLLHAYKIDGIVIGKYDHFSMPFVLLLLGTEKPIFLLQHNEIDQLNVEGKKGKVKRIFFNQFKNKVIHCVLEEFIKDYLVDKEKIDPQKICCWPHPVERNIEKYGGGNKFDCIGISSSNNDVFVSDVCDEEIQFERIKKEGLHVVLRSRNSDFDNGFLKVYSAWISDADYKNYFENTRSVLIAFKDGYHYRVSASIFDAFSHHIPVLCTDMPLARFYKERYPNICFIINNGLSYSIMAIIDTNRTNMEKEFDTFWKQHSDCIIQELVFRDFARHIEDRSENV